MKLHSATLSTISMPLLSPFSTHLGTVENREAILVEVKDQNGLTGYGEAVAFSSPWYTEETIKTSYHMLKDFFIPLLKRNPISHPAEVTKLLEPLRRNHMAKASLEMACWDLKAKQQGVSLSRYIGGIKRQIPAGVVVGAKTKTELLHQIESYLT